MAKNLKGKKLRKWKAKRLKGGIRGAIKSVELKGTDTFKPHVSQTETASEA